MVIKFCLLCKRVFTVRSSLCLYFMLIEFKRVWRPNWTAAFITVTTMNLSKSENEAHALPFLVWKKDQQIGTHWVCMVYVCLEKGSTNWNTVLYMVYVPLVGSILIDPTKFKPSTLVTNFWSWNTMITKSIHFHFPKYILYVHYYNSTLRKQNVPLI